MKVHMKKLLRLFLGGAFFCISASSVASVMYSFNGFFSHNNRPDQVDFTAGFEFTVPNFLLTNTSLSPSEMLKCRAGDFSCTKVSFIPDAYAAGLFGSEIDAKAIAISDIDGSTSYFYFEASSFSSPGKHASLFGVNPGTLQVSLIPEPATGYCVLAGLGLLGLARSRRRNY